MRIGYTIKIYRVGSFALKVKFTPKRGELHLNSVKKCFLNAKSAGPALH